MGIVQREINGRALYEAMKLNGHEGYIRGDWFQFDENGKPVAGCALGLMAINLKVKANTSVNTGANIFEQLNSLVIPETSKWYKYVDSEFVGSGIICWNDLTVDSEDEFDDYGNARRVYALSTFEEVHQMVYDLLQPHFATTFRVDSWEWDADDFNGNYEYEKQPDPDYYGQPAY